MDKYPITGRSLERFYPIDGDQFERAYKEHLSGFSGWSQATIYQREDEVLNYFVNRSTNASA